MTANASSKVETFRCGWTGTRAAASSSVTSYYRFEVDPDSPFPPGPEELPTGAIDTVEPPVEGDVPTTYLDAEPPLGVELAYFVRAELDDESLTGITNFARITTPAAAPAPDLVVANYTPASPALTAPAGGQVTLSAWRHQNQGDADADAADGTVSNGFYLSTDSVITATDVRLDFNVNTNGVLPAGADLTGVGRRSRFRQAPLWAHTSSASSSMKRTK